MKLSLPEIQTLCSIALGVELADPSLVAGLRGNLLVDKIKGRLCVTYKGKLFLEGLVQVEASMYHEKNSELEKVMNAIYFWHWTTALNYAEALDVFDPDALIILRHLSEKYGDCGRETTEGRKDIHDNILSLTNLFGWHFERVKNGGGNFF